MIDLIWFWRILADLAYILTDLTDFPAPALHGKSKPYLHCGVVVGLTPLMACTSSQWPYPELACQMA